MKAQPFGVTQGDLSVVAGAETRVNFAYAKLVSVLYSDW
jgi:hypothetical protein